MEPEDIPSQKPKWLNKLLENSWEAEMLISGGSIFALFTFAESFINFMRKSRFLFYGFTGMNELILFASLTIEGITVGFILHLLMRGTWISLVSLNSAIPTGINFTKLKLSGIYEREAKAFNLTESIIAIDKGCRLVFFASFAFVVVVIGYLFSLIVIFFVLSFFDIYVDSLAAGVIAVIYLLFIVDWFLSGWLLRKNRFIGKIFHPLYVAFDVITLGFIYRPWLQVLFSNVKWWKGLLFGLLFIGLTVVYANLMLVSYFHWDTIIDQRKFDAAPGVSGIVYESQLGKDDLVHIGCIASPVISGTYLKVFVPYRADYDRGIEAINAEYLSQIIEVGLNDSIVQKPDWIRSAQETTQQAGATTFLSINHLPRGKNILTLKINAPWFTDGRDKPVEIPFWKE